MGRPPLSADQRHESLVRRYEANVIRSEVGCWRWRRPVRAKPGYPALGSGKYDRILMHRFSYELHIGPIPTGLWALHHCDNKICTNPAHLFLGTHVDNAADARSKGLLQKERCRRGHLRTRQNTYERIDRRGYLERHCRDCGAVVRHAHVS